MTLELVREHLSADRCEGRLLIDGLYECVTLEPPRRAENPLIPHPAIPAGDYKVTIAYSPKFKCMLPHLSNVPGRSAIEIHAGNAVTETQGCILIGRERSGDQIRHSQDAVHQLMVKLAQVLIKDKPVNIVIEDPLKGEQRA